VSAGEHPTTQPLNEGCYWTLAVKDTGCGMDARTLGRIFEPFFTTKPVGQGTGMGLSLVHGIIVSCGGGIQVESEPGVGSLFRVFFPAASPATGRERAGDEELPVLVERHPRVLFVDDEERVCEVGAQMLRTLGCSVTTTPSPTVAARLLSEDTESFDVLITDYGMPEMSGIELAASARQARPRMPIVLTTGYPDRVTPEEAHAAGAGEILFKPYRRSDLVRALERALVRSDA
jgi:CheY-like chemotaxis protein